MTASPPENTDVADLLRSKADSARNNRDFSTAEELYTQLITMGKSVAWSWFSIGQIYLARDLVEEAFICTKAATDVDPNFFWAHYELLALCVKNNILSAHLSEVCDHVGGPLPTSFGEIHNGVVEMAVGQLWAAGFFSQAVALLEWISGSAFLTPLGLVRIVEKSSKPNMVAAAKQRLMSLDLSSLQSDVLRVLSQHMREIGDISAEMLILRQYWRSFPDDFQAFYNLGRRLARDGLEQDLAELELEGFQFSEKQQSLAIILFRIEANKPLLAFHAILNHARLYDEVPLNLGIRTAYALSKAESDQTRLRQLIALLSAWHEDEDEISVMLVNLSIARLDYTEAWRLFTARFGNRAGTLPVEARLLEVNILAHSNRLALALEKLNSERVDNKFPTRWVPPAVIILSEAGRWDEVVDVGLSVFPGKVSFRHILSPLVRAARKAGRLSDVYKALSELAHPLDEEYQAAFEGVVEEMVLQNIVDLKDLPSVHPIPAARLRRFALLAPSSKSETCEDEFKRRSAVYICVDRNYLYAGFTSLISAMVSNHAASAKIDFHVLAEDDVFEESERFGQTIATAFGRSITVTRASSVLPNLTDLRMSYGIFTGGHRLSVAAYYRIFFARHLLKASDYGRLLYLDSDTLVCGDLNAIFDSEMFQPLMARQEVSRPEVDYAARLHGLQGAYFNSGVLLFDATNSDLAALLEKAIDAATDPDRTLIFQDQCALNIAFDTRHQDLPKRFNTFVTPEFGQEKMDDSVVLHYLDRPKPWDSLYRGDADDWLHAFALFRAICRPVMSS